MCTTTILILTLALGYAEPDKDVTESEKKDFLALVAKLPTEGEFFTDEAIKKAAPHTRVLLALTKKDLEKYDLYAALALSRGLLEKKEPRQYGIAHFASIAHPEIKLFWATVLVDEKAPPREIVAYLRKALDSKEVSRTLALMLGPGFEDFKDRVAKIAEAGKPTRIELIKEHSTEAIPNYGDGFDYTNRQCVFASGQLLYAVRPLKQHELELADEKKP